LEDYHLDNCHLVNCHLADCHGKSFDLFFHILFPGEDAAT
jgi:hypothetical protein